MLLDDRVAFVEYEEIGVFEIEVVVMENVEENLGRHDEDVMFLEFFVPPVSRPVVDAVRAHVSAHLQVRVTTDRLGLREKELRLWTDASCTPDIRVNRNAAHIYERKK